MDKPILQRVAQGDHAAMEDCLDRFGRLVWSVVQRRCVNRADAEEVVQEVFLDVWRSASRFDPAIASEATFITMVARRRLIDRQRKQYRTVPIASLQEEHVPAVASAQSKPDNSVEVAEDAIAAREKLSELREEERFVLELSIDEGLSQSEIAERTQMPLGTVKSHARRGMLRLRQLLRGDSHVEVRGGTP